MSDDSSNCSPINSILDEYSISILTAVSASPITVNNLVTRFEMSRATAYRRMNALCKFGLVEEKTQIDGSGTTYATFVAAFESINLEIVNGVTYVHIVREDDHEVLRVAECKH